MSETREGWLPSDTAPEGMLVRTIIMDERGARNDQPLRRRGRLWFVPDGAVYVYYTPTHWRPIHPSAARRGG